MDGTIARAVPTERRLTARAKIDELPWLSATRLRPGRDVVLIDLSTGGALIEGSARLLPGTRAVLQLLGTGGCLLACGSVLRCHVSAITSEEGVTYRGALTFDQAIDFGKEARVLSRYPVAMRQTDVTPRRVFMEQLGDARGHDLPGDGWVAEDAPANWP